MRILLLMAFFGMPCLAETIVATAPVTAVTLYPQGATITRTATFDAPAGTHEVTIRTLPPGFDLDQTGIAATPGAVVLAIGLAVASPDGRPGIDTQGVLAARAEVARAEGVVRAGQAAIAVIRAKAEAATARAAFVQELARTAVPAHLSTPGVGDLRALAVLVGDEVLAARQAVAAADAEAAAAEAALQPDVDALDRARAALDPPGEAEPPQALIVTLRMEEAGRVTLVVTTLTEDAAWLPRYDMYLTRAPDALTVARAAVVGQWSGEDWRQVALTLSTAQPYYGWLLEIGPERKSIVSKADLDRAADLAVSQYAPVQDPVVVAEQAASGFDTSMLGDTFTYTFRAPVDLRTDGDAMLKLGMDTVSPDVALRAEAIPLLETRAHLVARIANTTGAPLLPGLATLYLDGGFVGTTDLPMVVSGDEAEVGFGPIQGLLLTRVVPGASEGAEGIFVSANRRAEKVVLTVENLTGDNWPLRLIDRVPYSEQDDLQISYTATPPVTRDSPDGKRGLLVWEFDIAAGARQEVSFDTRMDWPDGMVLE